MRIRPGIIIALFILAFIEYYCFVAIQVASRSLPNKFRYPLYILYALLSIASWIWLLRFRQLHLADWPPMLKTAVISFVMGFLLAKVIMASFMLIDDLRRIITWIVHQLAALFPSAEHPLPARDISRSAFIARAGILVGGLMLGGFLYGTRNKYNYKIKKIKLRSDDLPEAFRGLKIVQISDIHSGSFDDMHAVEQGVDLILKEKPDLILFTGDLVNNIASEIVPYKNIFSKLKAPMGVFSVLGNHDYGDYIEWDSDTAKTTNLERLKQHHADMGWTLLMNEHKIFDRAGEKIALLGVENWSAKPRFPKHGDLPKAYKGLEDQHIPFKILMSHDPSHWDAQVRPDFPDIALTLSGHTHGMQFGIRLPWMQWSPIQYMYKEWAGLYSEQNQHLYVNVGYGFLGYPGRLGIEPEITLIELL
jgi:predicted MPP superfamily phosphohydrolase